MRGGRPLPLLERAVSPPDLSQLLVGSLGLPEFHPTLLPFQSVCNWISGRD